ncbi:MAG TPA: ATP-grasp domain-containing protein [Polyangia bacterium]
MDYGNQPKVLLAATLWWPLSARLAARFVHYGCQVSAICSPGHLLHHVPGIGRVRHFRARDPGASLAAALDEEKPDIVIPCDDRAVWQLHELHGKRPDLRPLIESSLGPAAEFEIVATRLRLLETARTLGISVPETRPIARAEDVRAWFADGPRPSVMKADATWGGSGVRMVDSETEALAAYAALRRRAGMGAVVKRLLVNRDPLATWTLRKQQRADMTLQERIAGPPWNAMVAAWRGEVLAVVAVEVLSSQGTTGAGIVVRVVDNREIARAARLLAERLGMSGFFGLDFVIDAESGTAHLIELNPRCTQLGHLALLGRGDLASLLYAKLAGRPCSDPPAPIGNDIIAFFPQALQADPPSGFAAGAHVDIPWEHPSLVRELLLPLWPERQWLSRLYHRVRPLRLPPTVDHGERKPPLAAERAG